MGAVTGNLNTSMPLDSPVSVYVPCYNGEEHIGRCLQALLRQTRAPDEIIVVNDGSTDATAEVVRQFSGVLLVEHPLNRGLSAARNTGLMAAKYLWVAALDADVEAAPNWLENLLALRHDFPDTTGFGGCLIETQNAKFADRWRSIHIPQTWGDKPRVNPPFLYGCNTLFQKDHVMEVGGYDERLRTNGEDVDLAKRLYLAGRSLIYNPAAIAYHYRKDDLNSVLKMFWAHHRHPHAVLEPPENIFELIQFIGKYLLKRSINKSFGDFQNGRFDLMLISILSAVDSIIRETKAYYKH